MTASPAVKVVIAGDTKSLEKSLKKSGSALDTFKGTALGVFAGTALTGGIGLAIDAVKGLGTFALGGIDALDALGDNVARLDGLAKGLGDTVAAADLSQFGVDKGEAAAAALAVAKVGKSLQLSGKQLGLVTPKFTEMSAQLASLGDGDPEKQAELLAKALAGSAKAAKELGIHLPEGKDVTPMERYLSITSQLAPKLNDATSGTASLSDVGERWNAMLANVQLELAGFLEKLAPVLSALIDGLMPVLRQFIDVVGPLVATVFGAIAEAVSGFLAGGSGTAVADIFARIGGVLGKVADVVGGTIVPVFLDLAGAVGDALAPLLPPLAEAFDALMVAVDALFPVIERVWGFIGAVVVPLLKILLPIVSKILEVILKLAGALLRALGPAIDAAVGLFDDLVDALRPVFDWLNRILGLAGDVIGKLSNIHIPGINLAAGPTSQVAAPSQFATGGGVSVTIQTGVGDPVAIGRQVARYLDSWVARGGVIPGGAGTVGRTTRGRLRTRPA